MGKVSIQTKEAISFTAKFKFSNYRCNLLFLILDVLLEQQEYYKKER